ncbi:hypothetical protein V6N13_108439 [Hibiscus sabdariffa]|uniref:Uncharacterized protein n=1 Tax=Hibiscus sabdariffa TaxID=183260 RepID=A0ABR2SS71_9ROSI
MSAEKYALAGPVVSAETSPLSSGWSRSSRHMNNPREPLYAFDPEIEKNSVQTQKRNQSANGRSHWSEPSRRAKSTHPSNQAATTSPSRRIT